MGSREKHFLSGWLKPRVSPSCTWEPASSIQSLLNQTSFVWKLGTSNFETMKCQTLSMVPTKLVYQCLSSFSHWNVDKAWENTTLAIQLSGQWGQCFHITSMETISVNVPLKINIFQVKKDTTENLFPKILQIFSSFVDRRARCFWASLHPSFARAQLMRPHPPLGLPVDSDFSAGSAIPGTFQGFTICFSYGLTMFYPSSRVEQAHTPKSSVWGFHKWSGRWNPSQDTVLCKVCCLTWTGYGAPRFVAEIVPVTKDFLHHSFYHCILARWRNVDVS